jgi:hypothetical protein
VDCCDLAPAPHPSQHALSPTTVSGARRERWQRRGTLLGAVAVALLPKCPACWSVYAGLSSVLGLSFVVRESYLLPLTAVALALSLGALWLSPRRFSARRMLLPWLLACAGALVTLAGKFVLESNLLLYGGLAVLLAASLWSSGRMGWLPAARSAQN